jgi:hypothetical protein
MIHVGRNSLGQEEGLPYKTVPLVKTPKKLKDISILNWKKGLESASRHTPMTVDQEEAMTYSKLAISRPEDLRFGRAPHPVRSRRGIVIGAGTVYPELNFTLPTMTINASTWPEIREHYRGIVTDALD